MVEPKMSLKNKLWWKLVIIVGPIVLLLLLPLLTAEPLQYYPGMLVTVAAWILGLLLGFVFTRKRKKTHLPPATSS